MGKIGSSTVAWCIAPDDAAEEPVRLLELFLNIPCCFCEATSSLNCARVLTITRKFNRQKSSSQLQQRHFLPL